MMFDFETKVEALTENYGLELLLEQNDIAEEYVVRLLLDKGLINMDNYFYLDVEMTEWERMEE
jgi:hypothetical protein